MQLKWNLVLSAALVCGVGHAQAQTTFLSDDFEGYTTNGDVEAAGWQRVNEMGTATEDNFEVGSIFTLLTPETNVGRPRRNPSTLNGTASTGNFIISDSDWQSGADGDGTSKSNPTNSGASHDLITPAFSTVGGSGPVWFQADASVQLNNNGAAVFDVDVSVDGGETWTNKFRRVSPSRVSGNGATSIEPTPSNADGFIGRLSVDLTDVASGQENVEVRLRHFEPNFDWWVAVDNVEISDVPPPLGGSEVVLPMQTFDGGDFGQMEVSPLSANFPDPFFPTDTWSFEDPQARFQNGVVSGDIDGGRGVFRIGHGTDEVDFAFINGQIDPGFALDEILVTPSLDLSEMGEVFLHFDSETLLDAGDETDTESIQRVMVSLDGGATFEDEAIFDALGGGLFDNSEEPFFANRIFQVDQAAGQDDVVFGFEFAGLDRGWWALDNIMVTGNLAGAGGLPADFDGDGEVGLSDFNILKGNFGNAGGKADGDADGDGSIGLTDFDILKGSFGDTAAVPEPSSIVLTLLGLAGLFGFARHRNK